MRGLSVLALCLALAWATSPADESFSSQELRKRDGAHHHPPPPAPAPAPESSYAAPPSTGYESPGTGSMYYYYYPTTTTEPPPEEEEEDKKKDDKCDPENLLAPVILICIFLGIIAGVAVGLIPLLSLPNIAPFVTFPNGNNNGQLLLAPLAGLNNFLGGLANKPGIGRSWEPVDQATYVVTQALERDECLSRLLCESGKYAEGYENTLGILENLAPVDFEGQLKIFMDSAFNKINCERFTCSYLE